MMGLKLTVGDLRLIHDVLVNEWLRGQGQGNEARELTDTEYARVVDLIDTLYGMAKS